MQLKNLDQSDDVVTKQEHSLEPFAVGDGIYLSN
jgi:hypothetical protein